MAFYDKFPYTNFQELNLDKIITFVLEMKKELEEWFPTHEITFADPITWDDSRSYDKYTIVLGPDGNTYIAQKYVPAGVPISDTSYWLTLFNADAQIEDLRIRIDRNWRTPEDFGAIGDGTTDDSAAIRTALNSGFDLLFVPGKTYYVTVGIPVSASGFKVVGYGSRIRFGSASYGIAFSSSCHDITIEGLETVMEYLPNSGNPTSNHYETYINTTLPDVEYYTYNINFKNCVMHGGVNGITMSLSKNCTIEGCRFADFVTRNEVLSGGYGVLLQSCHDITVKNCHFKSGAYGRHDVYVSIDSRKTTDITSSDIIVDGCTFDHTEQSYFSPVTVAVNVRASERVKITNCNAINCTGAVTLYSENGEINEVVIENLSITGGVFRDASIAPSETRSGIGLAGINPITCTINNYSCVKPAASGYIGLSGTNARIIANNLTFEDCRIVLGEDVSGMISNYICDMSYYIIRFQHTGLSKMKLRNIYPAANLIGSLFAFDNGGTITADCIESDLMQYSVSAGGTFGKVSRASLDATSSISSNVLHVKVNNMTNRELMPVAYSLAGYEVKPAYDGTNDEFTFRVFNDAGVQQAIAALRIRFLNTVTAEDYE